MVRAVRISAKSLQVAHADYAIPLTEETELAEAGSEAVPITEITHEADFEYSATVEAEEGASDEFDLEPGLVAQWDAGDTKTIRILGVVDVAADEIGGPEEGAEDAIDCKIVDNEGNTLLSSEEDAGQDVAEGAAEFNFDGVVQLSGGDALRVVVFNRPTGEEAADGEAADYEVVATSELVITPV